MTLRNLIVTTLLAMVAAGDLRSQEPPLESTAWETIATIGSPTARHEATLIAFDHQLFLIGGRRVNPVDVFDPANKTWTAKSETPLELHHFQAVVVGEAIYLMGAMTGPYPREVPLEKIVVYYPREDRFDFKHVIPAERRRGGAGAVLYKEKIYVVGGITNGHVDGYQPWLDEYEPATGKWTPLTDAPHARDHFPAVVSGDRLYVLGGRTTEQKTKNTFALTVAPCDVYDFQSQTWLDIEKCPVLPTPRAGNMAISWENEVIVGGGESASQKAAHREVEAFDTENKTWRNWPNLNQGRHGSGFAIVGDFLYTASGSGNRGGGPELTSIERIRLPSDK